LPPNVSFEFEYLAIKLVQAGCKRSAKAFALTNWLPGREIGGCEKTIRPSTE